MNTRPYRVAIRNQVPVIPIATALIGLLPVMAMATPSSTPGGLLAAIETLAAESVPEELDDLLARIAPEPQPGSADTDKSVADFGLYYLRQVSQEGPTCMSIGAPSNGWLISGIRLESEPGLQAREKRSWGTPETIDAIRAAVRNVNDRFPNTPTLVVGSLSRKGGGFLPPHRSHQSGRDVDLGYYFLGSESPKGFVAANRRNLDVARTWYLIESLMEAAEVEYIFIDRRLQRVLHRYVRDDLGYPEEKLDALFQYPRRRRNRAGILRHSRGHRDHMHVRFYSPIAVAAVQDYIDKTGRSPVRTVNVYHRVRRGDSVWKIARRHRVSMKKIRRWNRLGRRTLLQPGQRLKVGQKRIAQPPPAVLETPGT